MEEEFMRLETNQEWDKHCDMLMMKSIRHKSDVGETASNTPFNRYLDIKPYDRSRVKLTRAKDTDYINANLVTVPKAARQYILTQGPLPGTLAHFWLMVWEQRTHVIVMLNRLIEMIDMVKCEQYWPESTGKKIHFKEVGLIVKLNSVEVTKHFTLRKMTLEDEETNTSRVILQFHYTAWLDYGQPDSPTSFLRLLAAVRKSGGLDKMDEPSVVHCSAGVGRSGTFCLIDSVLAIVENQGSTEGIDIVSTLLEMRDYRMGLIQTPIQLRFAYMSIIHGIKILERANKLHPHKSSISLESTQRTNSSQSANSKKSRRPKKRTSKNSEPFNLFPTNILVQAVDDVDSDSADKMFYDLMKPLPNLKKPKSSPPDSDLESTGTQRNVPSQEVIEPATKAKLLTDAMQSLLSVNVITTKSSSSSKSSPLTPTSDLLRRRELKNKQLAEKTKNIKEKMKAEELKRERFCQRMAFLKKSVAYGGVAALIVSSIVYVYLYGNPAS